MVINRIFPIDLTSIIETACTQPGKIVLEDFTLPMITSRRLPVGADLLADRFAARIGGRQERIGVLLTNANAIPVSLLALWALGKVPAILNYTAGPVTMGQCAEPPALAARVKASFA
jgi:acyl-CoA synthetase (AMP-forming)/AMP-acid ligase II